MKISEVRMVIGAWLTAAVFLAVGSATLTDALAQAAPRAQPVVPVASETLPLAGAPDDAQNISIPLNKAHPVDLPEPVSEVVVANPEIADVIVKSPTNVFIIARAMGATDVFFNNARGDTILHAAIVVEGDLTAAQQAISELLPKSKIKLKDLNGSIVLTGNVRSASESANASAIASRFIGENASVINMLRIMEDQQVLLKVRVAEIQRNVLKNLSAVTDFNRVIRNRNLNFQTTGGTAFATGITGSVTFNYMGLVGSAFSSLERQGLVKTLAEPALTAISGESANFLAGGQVPVPSGVDTQGNLVVEFRDFGVSLSFTPVVMANRQISLTISTEVSRQASENKLVLPFGTNNQTVDVIGLSVRRAESTVNLPSGGSLMIAGLIQSEEFNQFDGTPWLGDIPILGALFRSPAFQRSETELVVLVKAFLVRPVEPSRKLALPTDGFVPASDFDMFLMGRLYKQYAPSGKPGRIPTIKGPFGYIME
jgi:pilus assembly protein CpaC